MPVSDEEWMRLALSYAERAEHEQEVPVGCVIVKDDSLLAYGYNQPIAQHDPTAHAEIQALRYAGEVAENYRLTGTTLYVTLEPCVMCIGAILHARVERLVFGATDFRAGAVETVFRVPDETRLNHRLQYQGGILADECATLLRSFFKRRR